MAHFAQLENNIVTQVIVVNNQDILDENGQESEQKGIDFCSNLLGGTWLQTSYNGNIRKNYASVGHTYDEGRDAFIAPKPYASWVLDQTTAQWKAPIDYPTKTPVDYSTDEKKYTWDENTTSWKELL
jgi:hypothetical protein